MAFGLITQLTQMPTTTDCCWTEVISFLLLGRILGTVNALIKSRVMLFVVSLLFNNSKNNKNRLQRKSTNVDQPKPKPTNRIQFRSNRIANTYNVLNGCIHHDTIIKFEQRERAAKKSAQSRRKYQMRISGTKEGKKTTTTSTITMCTHKISTKLKVIICIHIHNTYNLFCDLSTGEQYIY